MFVEGNLRQWGGCYLLVAWLGLGGIVGCSEQSGDLIEASGTIEGIEIAVGTQVAGRIKALRVEEGMVVEQGDTLAILDATDYQLQLRQALARAQAAQAQYQLILHGAREEDIRLAQANLDKAQADYQRMQTLLETQTVTQEQFEAAQTRFITSQQRWEKLTRGARQEEIEIARANRDQALAQVELARKRVQDCAILAPSRGTVTLKAYEEGELVGAGANLLQLTVLDTVYLTIYVNPVQLGKIHLRQEAQIEIDAYPERRFTGQVTYLSPLAEFTPKNIQTKEERTKLVFAVKIQIPNPEEVLKPGLPADATLLPSD